jgi:hypothetical protein
MTAAAKAHLAELAKRGAKAEPKAEAPKKAAPKKAAPKKTSKKED